MLSVEVADLDADLGMMVSSVRLGLIRFNSYLDDVQVFEF